MQGNIHKVASHLELITNPEEIAAAKNGDLYIEKRPTLIIRGIPTQDTIREVYNLFATKKDINGDVFKLSHREKGIMLRDSWKEYNKITSKEFAKYLEHWTVLLDLTSYNSKPALAVVNSLPPMLTQLFHQPRYILPSMLEPFEWVD